MYKFRTTVLPLNKKLSVSLKNIYGIGWYKINYILSFLGFSFLFFINSLNSYYCDLLFFYLTKLVQSQVYLERNIILNIMKLENTFKGYRHQFFLPVHGQRTRTNANTQRSKRLTKNHLDK